MQIDANYAQLRIKSSIILRELGRRVINNAFLSHLHASLQQRFDLCFYIRKAQFTLADETDDALAVDDQAIG